MTYNTENLLKEFKKQSIACAVVDDHLNIIKYQNSKGQWHYLKGMVSDLMPATSYLVCEEKYWAYLVFKQLGLSTPETIIVNGEVTDFLNRHKRVVVKPSNAAHGWGISVNVDDYTTLIRSVEKAKKHSEIVLVQEQIDGKDLRLLLIGGKLISAVERRPAQVIGDGKSKVSKLISLENKGTERSNLNTGTIRQISIESSRAYLGNNGLNEIPKAGQVVRVSGPANHSLGGTVHEADHLITDVIKSDAEKLAGHLKAPVIGLDCLISETKKHYFLEINASPGIGIHHDKYWGTEANSYFQYVQWLYNH